MKVHFRKQHILIWGNSPKQIIQKSGIVMLSFKKYRTTMSVGLQGLLYNTMHNSGFIS